MTSDTETFLPTATVETLEITLPQGLMGLPELTEFELTPLMHSAPFLRLRSVGELALDFLLVEPGNFVDDYAFELSDEVANALHLESAEDVLILNIVTLHSQEPRYVTVNLIGPIILNRRTLFGRQIVLPRHAQTYSATHPLVDERVSEHAVAA
jgi:flagellar assembly factor FliW